MDPRIVVGALAGAGAVLAALGWRRWAAQGQAAQGQAAPGQAAPGQAAPQQAGPETPEPYLPTAEGLRIRRAVFDGIVGHCVATHPMTACGVVAGPIGSDGPERFIPMRNAAASTTFYEFDPHQQLAVWREMDDRDEDLVAIYYSHPATEAYPSRTTIALAVGYDAHYIIVSTRDPEAVQFRSFRIRDGEVTEEAVDLC